MSHRDQYVSDVTVIIKRDWTARMDDVIEQLNEMGVGIVNVNNDVGAIEGSCESNRVHMVQQMEFVEAVRTTFSYIADYPAGDPRDLDGPETDK